ncbi:hypothetical protein [Legionella sp. PC1000]|uniref:CC0125/CC1285 family lipoprotein n=1 Tax=Legionella sp. PC1000 TaxID=2746060 RepID=UPI0015FE3647|nr:hypothetical protein [Legionella sp. PC1000]
MKKIIPIISLIIMLFGCSTGYHPDGLTGGFSELQVANDTYVVKFQGNAYTNMDQAFKYALRRSAELTREKGYKYFKVISSSSNVNRSFYRTPVTANTTSNSRSSIYGNYGYGNYNAYGNSTRNTTTTFSGGDVYTMEKPITYIAIKLYKDNANGLLDADIILSNFKKEN